MVVESRVEEETGRMKIVRKGRAAVDPYYTKAEDVHVLEEGDTIFNVMLNWVRVTIFAFPLLFILKT